MPFQAAMAAWNSSLSDSENSAKWIWGLSCTRWLGFNVGLHVNPAAMPWLIHNTKRLHHLVQCNSDESDQVLQFSIRATLWHSLVFSTKRYTAGLLNGLMPCRRFLSQIDSLDFQCWLSPPLTSATFLLFVFFLSKPSRRICNCVPGANEPGGALRPEEDVCQQWARPAGVQMRDPNNGELQKMPRLSLFAFLPERSRFSVVEAIHEGVSRNQCFCTSPLHWWN